MRGVSDQQGSGGDEVRQIIRENSVSSETWKKMNKEQKTQVKKYVQKKIQEHYLTSPKIMIRRKTEKSE